MHRFYDSKIWKPIYYFNKSHILINSAISLIILGQNYQILHLLPFSLLSLALLATWKNRFLPSLVQPNPKATHRMNAISSILHSLPVTSVLCLTFVSFSNCSDLSSFLFDSLSQKAAHQIISLHNPYLKQPTPHLIINCVVRTIHYYCPKEVVLFEFLFFLMESQNTYIACRRCTY